MKNSCKNHNSRDNGAVRLAIRTLLDRQDVSRLHFIIPQKPSPLPLLDFRIEDVCITHLDYSLFLADQALQRDGIGRKAHLYLGLDNDAVQLEQTELAVIFMPKSKRLAKWLLAKIGEDVPTGANVSLCGINNSGIKSMKPVLNQLIGSQCSSSSAFHSTILTASVDFVNKSERLTQLQATKNTYTVSAWGVNVRVVTLPGVFSDRRLDDGTDFLLRHLEKPHETGRILDWGCGAGVIGALLQRLLPEAQVDMVDVSTISCQAARLTMRANALPEKNVRISNIFSEVHETYDLIISNPPFHQGQDVDYTISQHFIKSATRRLTTRGRLVLVANRFINYFDELRKCFNNVNVIAQNSKYRLIEAIKN